MVKHLPTMQETQVRSLGQEDPLEKEVDPLQYSCLENPMDGGAWWATDHGVAKSRPRLSDFSSLPFMLLYCCQPSSYIVLTCVLVSQHLWQAE